MRVQRLTESIQRVAAGEKCSWPTYDRMLHNPVENALQVEENIVLLEGNYLLLGEHGWRDLSAYADCTVSITADEALLRSRLIDRKIKTGVEEEKAIHFVVFSDMPNVHLCLQNTMKAHFTWKMDNAGECCLQE